VTQELRDYIDRVATKAAEEKYGRLELLAAAFIGETGFKPSECELVQDHTDATRVTYYFLKRA
jgi:hypothetical protein